MKKKTAANDTVLNGYTSITLASGEKVGFKFGTYALWQLFKKLGITEIQQMQETVKARAFEFITGLMLESANYNLVRKGEEPRFTEMDAFEWVDEMGGIASPAVTGFINAFYASVFRHAPAPGEVEDAKEG